MKKNLLAISLVLSMIGSLAGCSSGTAAQPSSQAAAPAAAAGSGTQSAASSSASASGTPIKIGGLLDFTGAVAELGPKFKAGMELAISDEGGSVAGHPIQLVTEDSATDVTKAVEQFKTLTEKEGCKLIVGPLMGDAQLAIAPLAANKKAICASLINGMYDTIKYKDYLIYPTTTEAQTYAFGQYVFEKLGYKTMVTVGANYAGKKSYTQGVIQGFTSKGGKVVQSLWPDVGTSDYSSFISTLKPSDCVLYALEGPAPVSRFIYQYKQAGKTAPLLTITQDGDYTPEALKELGDKALGIKGESSYTWQLQNDENKKFVTAIKAKTGNIPSSSEQNAYAVTKVFLEALKKTNGDDSYDKMWPAITSLKMDTPQGPLLFNSEGVAITDAYVTQAEKVNGQYQLSAPLDKTEQVKDARLKD